ncbi:MAG: tRNA pseudouridine(38-40) synthase TruA [Sediminibacterium sp.]|nr:tRNA pseudouridine(38-40) synthase TruA [Sediminibacterium sp.]
MPRYFLELGYKGTAFHGFQVQENAVTIQSEVEWALKVLFRTDFELTGSSRTDAGVHALQNYFHFDTPLELTGRHVYNLNAILPADICIHSIREVAPDAHCRFDAVAREYHYYLYTRKDPFMQDRGWHYPYQLDLQLLNEAASLLKQHTDFTSFAKRNAQVFTHNCTIQESRWELMEPNRLRYTVQANRFLRGMVRGLVGTMVKAGRGIISLSEFENILLAKDCTRADFSTPPQGLFLVRVIYP